MEESVKLRKQLTRTRVVVFVLVIFSILFLIYGLMQRMEAEKQRSSWEKQTEIAEQVRAEAERQRMLAVQSQAEADRQRIMAEQNAALAGACNQKKK
jgi:hypothetical protein